MNMKEQLKILLKIQFPYGTFSYLSSLVARHLSRHALWTHFCEPAHEQGAKTRDLSVSSSRQIRQVKVVAAAAAK
jgi:hypothetical protein